MTRHRKALTSLCASSVRITCQITESGKTESVDFEGVGQDSHVTVTAGDIRMQLIKSGDQIYVNAPSAFWQRNGAGADASKLANKWIKLSASKVPGGSEITLQGLAASFNATDSPLKPQVKQADLGGKPVVVIEQEDGSKLFVSATGAPVPLEMTNDGKKKGTLRFEGYGQQPPIKAPAGAVTAQQALGKPTTGNA